MYPEMIEESLMYQTMKQLLESLQQLQIKVQQLPDEKEYLEGVWQQVEDQLQEVNNLINTLSQMDDLQEIHFSSEEWLKWRGLILKTQAQHQMTLELLINKKESFYQEVRSIGRSLKASRAYNEMKRIQF